LILIFGYIFQNIQIVFSKKSGYGSKFEPYIWIQIRSGVDI